MEEKVHKISAFLSNWFIYGLNGIYLIMPLFLAKTFNTVEIGYLLAIQPFVLCLSPLFWGAFADRAKSQNLVMVILLVGATIAICSIRLSNSFVFVAVTLAIYAFFSAPYGSVVDVLTIMTTEKYNMNYGVVRIAGAVSYGFMAYIITLLTKTESFVVVYAIFAVLGIVSVFTMPVIRKLDKPEKDNSRGMKELLLNKELILLIAILALSFFTFGYYSSFFPTYITETLGLRKSVWGIVAFLTAFSEVPFFVYYSKVFKTFSMRSIVSVSAIAMMIRWIVFATVTNTTVLIAVSFVTGLFITVLTYCVTFYIVSIISPGLVNRAQSLMYAFGTGIPKVIAACVGGYMTEYLTEPVSFLICALVSATCLLFAIVFKKTMDSIDEKVRPFR